MPLSYNMGPGGLMYSPERDFAYNYPRMVAAVIRCFNTEFWPKLLETLCPSSEEDRDKLWEEICDLKDKYCQFINTCCQDPQETCKDVLDRTGVSSAPELAKVAWMAMLGQVVTGQLFAGVRDTTLQGQTPKAVIMLVQAGLNCAMEMNAGEKALDTMIARFSQLTLNLRELGLSQQAIRDLLAGIFNQENKINEEVSLDRFTQMPANSPVDLQTAK